MEFKNFLEVHDNFFRLAYSFGEMPREQIENLLNEKNPGYWSYGDRRAFTMNFGWSIPCKEAVDVIKQYVREPLYDVMAGSGYWAKILRKAGVNVIASDIHKVLNKNNYHQKKDDTGARDISHLIKPEKEKIIRRNALQVGHHIKTGRLKGDVLISWPPYQSSFSTDLLELLPLRSRVFYIGEDMTGCTGDASFHHFLCTNFKTLHTEDLPQWQGIHDYLSVHEKMGNTPVDPRSRGRDYWDDDMEKE